MYQPSSSDHRHVDIIDTITQRCILHSEGNGKEASGRPSPKAEPASSCEVPEQALGLLPGVRPAGEGATCMRLQTGRQKRTGPLDLLPLEAWSMIAECVSCVPDLWALTATCRCVGQLA